LPVQNLRLRPAIFQPSGTPLATLLERGVPERLPWGGLLLMSGEKPWDSRHARQRDANRAAQSTSAMKARDMLGL
jgi:hypothetical protein